VIWHGLPSRTWTGRKRFLVVASWLFYMGWRAWPVLLLIGTTLVDFAVGRALERTRAPLARRLLVTASVCTNLGLLGWFKYANFVGGALAPLVGPRWQHLLEVMLPIGISFYTFESLSYVIDVYRGEPASRRLDDFALFLAFFPHLVAGPIVRPAQFLPQLATPPAVGVTQVEDALARIATGFTKKLLLADTLAATADVVFTSPQMHGGLMTLVGMYAYAFQIYFDFSGYTDIAIGAAGLFGFRLPENFDRPYTATTLREFWQRWHVSLSTWLRDYLYVPLGGNRGGRWLTLRNLFLTMLLGGLWHGPAWNFVLWGGYHGALLGAERLLGVDAPRTPAGRRWRQAVTFHLVVLGWVVFRTPTLMQAGAVLTSLARPAAEPWGNVIEPGVLVLIAVLLHLAPSAAEVRRRFVAATPWQQGLAHAAVVTAVVLLSPGTTPFIYFQF